MNETLLVLMKQSRDEREQFFLQGAKLCYTAKPNLQSNFQLDEQHLEDIKARLTELVDESEYVNPLDGKVTKRSKVFAEVEVIDALFCTYDMTAIFGESVPEDLANDIKMVLHRLHYSTSGIISWEGLQRLTPEPITQSAHRSVEIFSLKVGKPEYSQQLLHELFVMLLYTNRLRKLIPNFQLAYASLNLQRPSVHCQNSNQASSIGQLNELTGICPCDTKQTVDYLLLEKLNGVTMTEALKTCSLDDFISWMLQLSLSIEMGVIHFGFTHNNLHTDNVIIRKLDTETSIRYFHQNQLFLLRTSTVAVITNFEVAHVKHKYDGIVNQQDEVRSNFVVNQSEHFGPLGFTDLGIYHNETRPFYDLYKVLMWSLKILEKHNNHGEDDNVFLRARKASKFFGFVYERDLKKALDNEAKLGFIYSLTISNAERSRSISDFVKQLLLEFPRYNRFRRADTGLLTPAELQLGYLDCSNFCLLDGRSRVINYDQASNHQNGGKHDGKVERLRFLGAQGCLERYQGLRKRAEELARLVGLVCNVDLKSQDKAEKARQKAECKRFTEEALEADKEFKDFKALLEVGKAEIWQETLEEIHLLRVKIDDMIRINNSEIQVYYEQLQSNEADEVPLKARRELLCHQQETIKGKIVTLVGSLATLNNFNLEFQVGQITPHLSISEMLPIE